VSVLQRLLTVAVGSRTHAVCNLTVVGIIDVAIADSSKSDEIVLFAYGSETQFIRDLLN